MFRKSRIKGVVSILLIAVYCALLTACNVSFGNARGEISWWVIAAPALVILVIAHILLIRQTYQCPKCGARFSPKWYELSVCLHIGNERLVKCPCCKKRGFCKKAP